MVGGSMEKPLGAISYVNAFAEILEQAEEQDLSFSHILHATGSCGTQAGLVVGAKALKNDVKILGISVSDDKESVGEEVLTIAQDTMQALGLEIAVKKEDIVVFDEYIKEGYGVMDKDVAEALRFMSNQEGIFLDPVYTGKALTGLIDLVKKGFLKKEDNIIFIHTGGTPALFPNKFKLVDFLKE
jgi:1-aminocyclopropane-1-carboxylate deaminase/D-cysteine desulfhydrase-like pyridoxal-dependent ACC family enzyme